MLEVIAIVAVALVVAIAAVLILAATKPDTFRVQRAAAVRGPPEKIFSLINDFHQWGSWSPWENRDPAMKRAFTGTESGKGAVYAWDGNRNVGSGQMEIIDVILPSKIVIKLDFIKPFEGHNTAEIHNAVARRCNGSKLGDVRSRALHAQGDAGVHEHGPDDRQGFRSRSGQPEKGCRAVIEVHIAGSPAQPRSRR